MGMNVDANGRSILHKGHGMTHTAPVPDVCKTPSPGGPVPIPYVNVAMDSNITDGAETVKIEGNPVANLGAKIATSTGDEAGSAGGGIVSSKIKGTVTWKMGSLDVKAEGKSVVRFLETNFHNGNSFNTTGVAPGETGMAYGDDFTGNCPVCDKGPSEHKIPETKSSADLCAQIIEGLHNKFAECRESRTEYLVAKKNKDYITRQKIWTGYMVGVMICAHESKPTSFAAMSGAKKPPPGFIEVASKIVDVVLGDGEAGGDMCPVDASALAGASSSPTVDPAKLVSVVNQRWEQTAGQTGDQYAPVIGICAAQHLITKSNHAPANITEMFFAPKGQTWAKNYPFKLDGAGADREFGPHLKKTPATPWGASVASCKTCQEILFLALCPKRVCKGK
jgi:uncharacterized Zn-binding protein involved in type VI secretion